MVPLWQSFGPSSFGNIIVQVRQLSVHTWVNSKYAHIPNAGEASTYLLTNNGTACNITKDGFLGWPGAQTVALFAYCANGAPICTAWPLKPVMNDEEKVLKCSHDINWQTGGWGHARTTKCAAQLVSGCNVMSPEAL